MGEIKVYIKVNENNIVVNINSSIFLSDTNGWIEIDEGFGDRYSHAQGNYLDKGLSDMEGRYNYKYKDGKVVELTAEEKKVLYPPVIPIPTDHDRINFLESAVKDILNIM